MATYEQTRDLMMERYPSIFPCEACALDHLFFTLGNGYVWEGGELVEESPEEDLSSPSPGEKVFSKLAQEWYQKEPFTCWYVAGMQSEDRIPLWSMPGDVTSSWLRGAIRALKALVMTPSDAAVYMLISVVGESGEPELKMHFPSGNIMPEGPMFPEELLQKAYTFLNKLQTELASRGETQKDEVFSKLIYTDAQEVILTASLKKTAQISNLVERMSVVLKALPKPERPKYRESRKTIQAIAQRGWDCFGEIGGLLDRDLDTEAAAKLRTLDGITGELMAALKELDLGVI